jgi:membrane protein implicated in regulation of membrane protease activity
METFYIACAAVGGTLLVCQFLMGLLGLGHHELGGDHDFGGDHDVGADHDVGHGDGHHEHGHAGGHSWFVGVLTFRTLAAAVTFFGLGGWLAVRQPHFDGLQSLPFALLAGGAALFAVAWLMRSLSRLQAEGNVRIERSVGKTGTVYLPVPGRKAGVGKVHLNLQNRTVEYQAVTSQEPLPSGAKVVVVGVVGADTVEVAPTETGRSSHV